MDMTNQQFKTAGLAGGLGGLGAGLGALFMGGGKNPADAAMPYFNKIPGMLQQYAQPWMQAGMNQLSPFQNQLSQLTSDPGGFLNKIGSSYHESPGYKWQLGQGLNAASNAAGAGGMLGSQQHQQQAAGMAEGLANQDYYNYLQHALGLFGTGFGGEQNLIGQGQTAATGLGENLANTYGAQGQLAYSGQANQNQQNQGSMGSIFGAVGNLLPFLLG